jgi:hypothetical protein
LAWLDLKGGEEVSSSVSLQDFQELGIYGVSTDFASASRFPFLLLFDFLSWVLGVKGEGIQ